MKIKTVQHFIKNHGEVYFNGYKWLTFAKTLVAQESLLYESEWNDPYKEKYKDIWPLNIAKESTYENCVCGSFKVCEDKLTMHLKIYDGDNFSGMPTGLRCTYTIPVSRVSKELKTLIEYRAESIADDQCQREDAEAYALRVQNRANSLLYPEKCEV